MPSLLDLPAELIDEIYEHYEQLRWADEQNGNWDSAGPIGQYRLTCRFLQNATRRSFVRYYFLVREIDITAACLQRLVAVAEVPELAEAVQRLAFYLPVFGDEVILPGDGARSDEEDEYARLSRTEEIWQDPVFEFVLRSFVNVSEVKVLDDHDRGPPNNNFDDEDDSSDARDQPYFWDVSWVFNHVMRAMDTCGVSPTWMAINTRRKDDGDFVTGLCNVSSFATLSRALSRLESLNIRPMRRYARPFGQAMALQAPQLLGTQLVQGFTSMPMLRHLGIDGDAIWGDKELFRELARAPAVPTLHGIRLILCRMDVVDFNTWLRKHLGTLRYLYIEGLCLDDGSTADVAQILQSLKHAAITHKLESLDLSGLALGWMDVSFPSATPTHTSDVTDPPEDGEWVMVERADYVSFQGKAELIEGLDIMSSRIVLG